MRDAKNRNAAGKLMVETTDGMHCVESVIQLLADTSKIPRPAPLAAHFVDMPYLKAVGLQ